MNDINIGDYILGKEEIWEIVAINKIGANTVYDIKCLTQPGDFLSESPETSVISRESISRSHIRHLGEVVPRDSQKAVEILFGK